MKLTVVLLSLLIVGMFPMQNTSALLTFDEGPYAFLYYSDFGTLTIDGVINANEYPDSLILTDRSGAEVNQLYWGHNNTHVAIGLTAKNTGWLGIGFGDVGVSMSGADIKMGYVKSGVLTLEDMYSVTQGKPFTDDLSSISANASAGTEVDGVTTIEFIIPLASGDSAGKDLNWSVGNIYGFFTAYHKTADNLGFKHTSHTDSMSVKLLDNSYPSPVEVSMSVSIIPDQNNESVSVAVELDDPSSTVSLLGTEVGIYKKSIFGKALIDVIKTDNNGFGAKDIAVDIAENLTIVAVVPASVGIKRIEASDDTNFVVDLHEDVTTQFGDLRDTFGERMMRDLLITLFLMTIVALMVAYTGTLLDVYSIYKEGKKEEL